MTGHLRTNGEKAIQKSKYNPAAVEQRASSIRKETVYLAQSHFLSRVTIFTETLDIGRDILRLTLGALRTGGASVFECG